MEVSKTGCSTYVQSGIVLQVASSPTIDAVLRVGSVTEKIEVQADATMVETHSTGIGQVVDQQRVVDLPLNGRNPQELIFLAGAAVEGRNDSTVGVGKNYPVRRISVAGGGTTSMTYVMDGGTYNDPENNLTMPIPFPDALQEFKVETSALPAQYGLHGAAAVNIVTKSGSNAFHGGAFLFVRNYIFNARPFSASARNSLKRNQYGGTLGGPIKKDKLFFFLGYQDTNQRSNPATNPTFVPTAAMKAGDFRTLASPQCSGTQRTLRNPPGYTGGPGFVDNQINPAEFSRVAVKYISYLPAATNECGSVFFGVRQNRDEHQGLARGDYNFSDKHMWFTRYYITHLFWPVADVKQNILNANGGGGQLSQYQALVLGSTYLISPTTISQFRMAGNRTNNKKLLADYFSPTDPGINVYHPPTPPSWTLLTVNGGPTVGAGMFLTYYPTISYQLAEDMSMVRGSHQIGFGVNWIHSAMNSQLGNLAFGQFTFNGSQTGLGMTDLFLGRSSAFQQNALTGTQNRLNYLGLYVQDSRQATSRLTVNAGLRWDPYFPVTKKYDRLAHFDRAWLDQGVHSTVWPLAPAGVLYPGDPVPDGGTLPRGVSNTRWNNFAPRLGLSWDPQGNGRMTVRAAYGIFYDPPQLFWINANQHQPPWGFQVQQGAASLEDPWADRALWPNGNPYPHVRSATRPFNNAATHYTFPLNHKSMYTQQWNLSIQRQIGANWVVSGTYLGNSVIHVWTARDDNPAVFIPGQCVAGQHGLTADGPCSSTANYQARRVLTPANPAQGRYYGRLYSSDEGATQNYNGLLLSVQRRFAAGASVQANYTWSHCIGDVQNPEAGNVGYADVNNRAYNRGNCQLVDRRHVLNFSAVAEVPQFAGQTMRLLASGWKLSAIGSAQTGTFADVTTGGDTTLAGQTEDPQPRPDLILSSQYPEKQTIDRWVNRAACQTPANGVYGNLGASSVLLPGLLRFDMSLSRIFQVREGQRCELRWEVFNVINRVNFGAPNLSLTNPAFGRVLTTSTDPRIMQFALKYYFQQFLKNGTASDSFAGWLYSEAIACGAKQGLSRFFNILTSANWIRFVE